MSIDLTVYKKQIDGKISDVVKNLLKKFSSNSDNDINNIQTILIQEIIERVSKICFINNFEINFGRELAKAITSDAGMFKDLGLPGVIWETIDKELDHKIENHEGQSEFEIIFNTLQVQLLKKIEIGKKIFSCC